MQHPRTDTGSSGPHCGKKEQTIFVHVPLMTRIVLSHNPRIPAFEGNPASYVQANGSNKISLVLSG